MRSLLRSIGRGVDTLLRCAAFASLTAMILIITLQIIFRVFFQALVWSEEAARYLLVWTSFLGAVLAYRHGRHIAVTFLVDALPGRFTAAARLLAHAAAIVFFTVIIVVGFRYMHLQSFQVSASLRIPMPIVYAVIPLSAVIMLIYALGDIIKLCVPALPASKKQGS